MFNWTITHLIPQFFERSLFTDLKKIILGPKLKPCVSASLGRKLLYVQLFLLHNFPGAPFSSTTLHPWVDYSHAFETLLMLCTSSLVEHIWLVISVFLNLVVCVFFPLSVQLRMSVTMNSISPSFGMPAWFLWHVTFYNLQKSSRVYVPYEA